MNKPLLTSSILTLALLSTHTFAADAGFGVFGAVGQAKHELKADNNGIDDSDTSFTLGGEYRFNSNFSVDVRYDNFGAMNYRYADDFSSVDIDYAMTSFSSSVKGILPLSEQFSLFAKVGISRWDIDVDLSATQDNINYSYSESFSDSGTDFHYGFGGQFAINNNLVIGLEYTMFSAGVSNDSDPEDTSSADYDISNLSLSLGYNF